MRTPDEKLAQRRREQILQAAIACFVKNGFHNTGMKAICQAAGMSTGAVYRYFPGKADIIRAIVEGEKRRSDKALKALASANDFSRALLKFTGQLVKDACREPDNTLATEIFAEACRDSAIAAVLSDSEKALIGELGRVIDSAHRQGRLNLRMAPEALARLIISLSYGMSAYAVLDPSLSVRQHVDLAKRAVAAQIEH